MVLRSDLKLALLSTVVVAGLAVSTGTSAKPRARTHPPVAVADQEPSDGLGRPGDVEPSDGLPGIDPSIPRQPSAIRQAYDDRVLTYQPMPYWQTPYYATPYWARRGYLVEVVPY